MKEALVSIQTTITTVILEGRLSWHLVTLSCMIQSHPRNLPVYAVGRTDITEGTLELRWPHQEALKDGNRADPLKTVKDQERSLNGLTPLISGHHHQCTKQTLQYILQLDSRYIKDNSDKCNLLYSNHSIPPDNSPYHGPLPKCKAAYSNKQYLSLTIQCKDRIKGPRDSNKS